MYVYIWNQHWLYTHSLWIVARGWLLQTFHMLLYHIFYIIDTTTIIYIYSYFKPHHIHCLFFIYFPTTRKVQKKKQSFFLFIFYFSVFFFLFSRGCKVNKHKNYIWYKFLNNKKKAVNVLNHETEYRDWIKKSGRGETTTTPSVCIYILWNMCPI